MHEIEAFARSIVNTYDAYTDDMVVFASLTVTLMFQEDKILALAQAYLELLYGGN